MPHSQMTVGDPVIPFRPVPCPPFPSGVPAQCYASSTEEERGHGPQDHRPPATACNCSQPPSLVDSQYSTPLIWVGGVCWTGPPPVFLWTVTFVV